MIKNIFIRLLSLILLLTLTSCDFSFSVKKELTPESDDDSPYLKYTPEECVKDIDCAWYAFEGMVFTRGEDDKSPKVITKWALNPIYLSIAGDASDKKRFLPIIEKNVKELSDIIGIPIIISKKKFNIIIVLSDDFERDIYGRYKKDLLKTFGGYDDFFKAYEASFRGNECFSFLKSAPNSYEMLVAITFLPNSKVNKSFSSCLSEISLSQSFGLFDDKKDALYTVFSDSVVSLTVLDKFLLKILYHKSIKPGMKSEEVKGLFYKIYKTIDARPFLKKHS